MKLTKKQEEASVKAMLDGADTQYSRDFFVQKGKEGGKIGGKKSWAMLTKEEQKTQIERLRQARLSTRIKSKLLSTKGGSDKI